MASINPVKLKRYSRYDSHDGWACRTKSGTILWHTAFSTKAEADLKRAQLRAMKVNGKPLFGELELVRVKLQLAPVEGPAWRRTA